jgi:hypothetical protein
VLASVARDSFGDAGSSLAMSIYLFFGLGFGRVLTFVMYDRDTQASLFEIKLAKLFFLSLIYTDVLS